MKQRADAQIEDKDNDESSEATLSLDPEPRRRRRGRKEIAAIKAHEETPAESPTPQEIPQETPQDTAVVPSGDPPGSTGLPEIAVKDGSDGESWVLLMILRSSNFI